MSPLPLEGITVVSLEQAVAAPFATRQLADLGARVIKVERPGTGDFARGYDESVHGQSSYFVWLNRSKESLTLDIKTPAGREVLERLLAEADVFVQNLAPGAARRLGLGAEELSERYPSIVVCDISGYGNTGPWADRKAYDLLVQCETGVVSLTGSPEEPAKVGISIADIAAGMYAYSGILTALYERRATGRARSVEVSLFEALSEWMGSPRTTRRTPARSPHASAPSTRRSPRTDRTARRTAGPCCSPSRTNANGRPSARSSSATPPRHRSAVPPELGPGGPPRRPQRDRRRALRGAGRDHRGEAPGRREGRQRPAQFGRGVLESPGPVRP